MLFRGPMKILHIPANNGFIQTCSQNFTYIFTITFNVGFLCLNFIFIKEYLLIIIFAHHLSTKYFSFYSITFLKQTLPLTIKYPLICLFVCLSCKLHSNESEITYETNEIHGIECHKPQLSSFVILKRSYHSPECKSFVKSNI